jgi:hypothetical protein
MLRVMLTVILIFALFLSCAVPIRNFSTMEFRVNESYDITRPDSKILEFTISTGQPIKKLRKAKATLLFQDPSTGNYLNETYKLIVRDNKTLVTEDAIDIKNKKEEDILFVVKFEYKKMVFFSNAKRTRPLAPGDEKITLQVVPREGSEAIVNDIVYELQKQNNFLARGKEYEIYRIMMNDGKQLSFPTFASDRFRQTTDEQPLEKVMDPIVEFFNRSPLKSSNNISFVVRGVAPVTPVTNWIDEPSFANEQIYTWDKARNTLIGSLFSCSNKKYTQDDLPKLRALETKQVVQRRLYGIIPDVDNRVFAVFQRSEGSDTPENRRIDIYAIVQSK